MSIRTSPQLTPQLLDAARLNGRRSHGPCTAAGKQNSKMNALEHGERSDPDNHYEVMRALGEDPARFDALKQELSASFSTGDPFVEKQVDDLTRLYWRRERLDRSQTGLMRRALLALEDQQHRRRKEIEDCTMEVGEGLNVTHEAPSDPAARLRLLLSFLALIRLQVHSRYFLAWQAAALQGFYRNKTGWRGPRLCFLLSLFAGSNLPLPLGGAGAHVAEAEDDEEDDIEVPLVDAQPAQEAGPFVATEPADELRYKQLVLLLADEVAAVEQEFEYEEKLNEEKSGDRARCLPGSGGRRVADALAAGRLAGPRHRPENQAADEPAESGGPNAKAADLGKQVCASPGRRGAPCGRPGRRRGRPRGPTLRRRERRALSRGERVSGSGGVISRSVTGEGFFPRLE